MASGDSDVGISTTTRSGCERIRTPNPLSRKTSIIRWFCGQHLCLEHRDTLLLGRLGQVREQDRAKTLALKGVGDLEGDLRPIGAGAFVHRVSHDSVVRARQCHEPEPVPVVDLCGPVRRRAQVDSSREEPQSHGVAGEAFEEAQEVGLIAGTHRAHMHSRAVAQRDIRFAVCRVGGARDRHGQASLPRYGSGFCPVEIPGSAKLGLRPVQAPIELAAELSSLLVVAAPPAGWPSAADAPP